MRSARKREADDAAAARAHAESQKARQKVDPVAALLQAQLKQAATETQLALAQLKILASQHPDLFPPDAPPASAPVVEEVKVPRSRRLPGQGNALSVARGVVNFARQWRRERRNPPIDQVVGNQPLERGNVLVDHQSMNDTMYALPPDPGRKIRHLGSEASGFKVCVQGPMSEAQIAEIDRLGWGYAYESGWSRIIGWKNMSRADVERLVKQLGLQS